MGSRSTIRPLLSPTGVRPGLPRRPGRGSGPACARVRRLDSTGQGRGLDAGFAQCLADRGSDLAGAFGVTVDADRVAAAGTGEAQRLLRGEVRVEDRARLAARRERAVWQYRPVGATLSGARV